MAGLVAAALGCVWTDLDRKIEADTGRSIPDIFSVHGESAFRELERAAMAEVLGLPPHVIAPGGGWIAQPGNFAVAESVSLTIYMAVTPEVAASRLVGEAGRPLLGSEPLPRLRELLAERERWYRLAAIEVAADGSPERTAAGIVTAARQYGGWSR